MELIFNFGLCFNVPTDIMMRISLISGVDFVDKIHKAAKELQKNSGYQSRYTPPSETSSGNYIPNYQ